LELYNQISLSQKPFGIGHMYIHTFLFRMTDLMTSQNIDLSSWDSLYIYINTVSTVRAQQYFDCCLRICCLGNLFTKPLPSHGRLLRLQYSGFQALCYNRLDRHILRSILYTRQWLRKFIIKNCNTDKGEMAEQPRKQVLQFAGCPLNQ
jgi:hypothetical protein